MSFLQISYHLQERSKSNTLFLSIQIFAKYFSFIPKEQKVKFIFRNFRLSEHKALTLPFLSELPR